MKFIKKSLKVLTAIFVALIVLGAIVGPGDGSQLNKTSSLTMYERCKASLSDEEKDKEFINNRDYCSEYK